MKDKRFEIIRNVGIVDNLTGELLQTLTDVERMLNKLNKEANNEYK